MQKNKMFTANNASILFIIAFFAYALLSTATGLFDGDTAIYLGYIIPQVVFTVAIVAYGLYKDISFVEIVPVKKGLEIIAIPLFLAVMVGLFLQNLFISESFSWAMVAMGVKMEVTMPSLETPLQIFLAILFLAVLPAVGEEMMYRGCLISGFKEKGDKYAILMSALFFSLSHLNMAQLVHQFIMGIILAYIVVKTGSIWYGVIIHFLNNLVVIVLPAICPEVNNLFVCSGQNALILGISAIIGVAILYPTLYYAVKFASKQDSGNNIFTYLFKKSATSEIDVHEKSKPKVSYWVIADIVILAIMLVVLTILKFKA